MLIPVRTIERMRTSANGDEPARKKARTGVSPFQHGPLQQVYVLSETQQNAFDTSKTQCSLTPHDSPTPLSLPIKLSLVDAIQPNFRLPFLPTSIHERLRSILQTCREDRKGISKGIDLTWTNNTVPDQIFKARKFNNGTMKCLKTTLSKSGKAPVGDGFEFACKRCCNEANKSALCLVVKEDGILTLLPAYRKTSDAHLTPSDEAYWLKKAEECMEEPADA